LFVRTASPGIMLVMSAVKFLILSLCGMLTLTGTVILLVPPAPRKRFCRRPTSAESIKICESNVAPVSTVNSLSATVTLNGTCSVTSAGAVTPVTAASGSMFHSTSTLKLKPLICFKQIINGTLTNSAGLRTPSESCSGGSAVSVLQQVTVAQLIDLSLQATERRTCALVR
jgi:hypothetical protein